MKKTDTVLMFMEGLYFCDLLNHTQQTMVSTEKGSDKSRSSDNDRHRKLVHRVISSATFAKSERLSSFLSYICDCTLKGHAGELNEQRIGEAVFGRTRDYDSSSDGIVRTQASRLRQRLDRYFSDEGAREPIRIVLPRGGYVPVFEPRPSSQVLPVAPAAFPSEPVNDPTPRAESSPSEPPPLVRHTRSLVIAWSLVALLAITVVAMQLRHSARAVETREGRAALHPLWSHLFVEGQRTLIVPGDSALVIWEGLMNRRLGLAEFLRGNYRSEHSTKPAESIAYDLSNRRYTSIVDLEVVQRLSRIAQSERGTLEMRYARDLRPNDLKDGNIVLVGATEANPWVELYEPVMNFTFSVDPSNHLASIYNRAPQGDEPQRWDLQSGKAYAIVAYLPGLTGTGNSLIIGGTSMIGTESALDFISDDSQLLPFLKRIQRPDRKLPHFQLVLGTNGMSGNAVRSNILAWRTTD